MWTTLLVLALLTIAVYFIVTKMKSIGASTDGTSDEVKICKTTGSICCGGGDNCTHRKTKPRHTYYEDEELDRFRGRAATDYSPTELEEWSEVVETLRPTEVEGWLSSIHQRGLHVPDTLQKRVVERISQAKATA